MKECIVCGREEDDEVLFMGMCWRCRNATDKKKPDLNKPIEEKEEDGQAATRSAL